MPLRDHAENRAPKTSAAKCWQDPCVEHVKIRFALQRDDDGWPPAESEGLWAQPLGVNRYRIDNTPWFVRGVAADDIVEARPDDNGVLWAHSVVQHGGRLVIRVICRADGPYAGDRQAVLDAFSAVGVSGEGTDTPISIVALDVAPDASLRPIRALLTDGEADGRWYFEEGCVSEKWRALG